MENIFLREAKELLRYYFSLLAVKSDVVWGHDNAAEVEAIVDLIAKGIKLELEEVRK